MAAICRALPQARLSEPDRCRVLSPTSCHSTNRLTIRNRTPIFNHMVELEAPQLDTVFHALGDSTRRRMLRELASGERTVGQLAEPFAISLSPAPKPTKAPPNPALI